MSMPKLAFARFSKDSRSMATADSIARLFLMPRSKSLACASKVQQSLHVRWEQCDFRVGHKSMASPSGPSEPSCLLSHESLCCLFWSRNVYHRFCRRGLPCTSGVASFPWTNIAFDQLVSFFMFLSVWLMYSQPIVGFPATLFVKPCDTLPQVQPAIFGSFSLSVTH